LNFKTNEMESIKTISELNSQKKLWETPILMEHGSKNTESGTSTWWPEAAHQTTSVYGTMS